MTTYYKAVRPDGTSFHDPSFRWVPESGPVEGIIVTHPHPHHDDPSGWLSAATVPTDCTGMRWDPTSDPPMRLLALTSVEGHPVTAPTNDLPNKRAASAWLVVRELPATDALGPQGVEVAAIIDRASRLTADEARRLAAAWGAVRYAAWDAAWGAVRDAAWGAVRDAAWDALWDAAYDALWDAARDAAWDAARGAAWDAAWDAAWGAVRYAAWATLVHDLITPEQYDTLMGPWREVIGRG